MHSLELGEEIEDPLAPYAAVDRRTADGRCWVTAHMVAGLDGCAAVHGRVGRTLHRPGQGPVRRHAHAGRRRAGGGPHRPRGGLRTGPPLAGAHARPALRKAGPPTPPLAIVSRSLDLDWDSRAFAAAPEHSRTIVVTCDAAPADRLARAREVADVLVAGAESVDPDELFTQLSARGLSTRAVRGRPDLAGRARRVPGTWTSCA